jgi:hypothetical protein
MGQAGATRACDAAHAGPFGAAGEQPAALRATARQCRARRTLRHFAHRSPGADRRAPRRRSGSLVRPASTS